jgi:hypothetical protein
MSYDFNCANCGKSGVGRPTGGSTLAPTGWVWNKSFGFGRKAFCSNRCLAEFNKQNDSDSNSSSSSSSEKSSKSNPGIISSFIQNQREEDRLDEQRRQKQEDKIDSTVESIIAVQFGQSADEIADSLNQLVTIGTSNNDEKIKKAVYEKMDYGIIKLKKLGAESEADFFQKKLDKIYVDKKKVRMEKAQKLRSEDKVLLAFLVEHPTIKKILIVVAILLLMQLKQLIFG